MDTMLSGARSSITRAIALVAAGGGALAVGCASPGPPQPPSLHLPERASDLKAERVSTEVRIEFVVSDETTDGGLMKGPIVAVLCRGVAGGACQSIGSRPVSPGPAMQIDQLPSDLTSGRDRLLEYKVELRNTAGRSVGPSQPVYAAAGLAPLPVEDLTAKSEAKGAVLTWKPARTTEVSTIVLHRLTVLPAPNSGKSVSPTLLQVPEIRAANRRRSGTVDSSARLDQTVQYTAQRIRTIDLLSATGSQRLTLQSAESAPVRIVLRDTFPPASPTSLVGIVSTRLDSVRIGGVASPGLSVDLSWHANNEADLAGYNIFRRELDPPDAPNMRLNSALVTAPAYEDISVENGHRYAYRVSAVDQAGNESAASVEIMQTAEIL